MSEQKKVFKISDLAQMETSNVTDNDLIMVSDAVDPKKDANYVSKKLSIGDFKKTMFKNQSFSIDSVTDLKETLSAIIVAFGGTIKSKKQSDAND